MGEPRRRQRFANGIYRALEKCGHYLTEAIDSPAEQIEVMAENLRAAAVELGRITGRIDVEDLLDSIFRDFCIGK